MGSMDFQISRIKHIAWKTKLKSFLEGKGGLTEEQATSHRDCDLGKWLYAEGLSLYGNTPEMKRLEMVHAELHDTVRRIISLKNSGDVSGAEIEYKKIGPISDEIVSLLIEIEMQVKTAK